jgi:hypothetical protein
MLTTAYGRWLLAGEPSLDGFIESVSAILAEARQLALGRVVQVPLLVSFKNVGIPGDREIALPWGKLRRRRPVDDKFLGGDPEARLILATTAPLRILRKAGPAEAGQGQEDQMFRRMEEFYPQFEEWNRAVTRTSDLTRYALLLGPKSLDTAMRRTLSAVASRTDPVDGFVDAVLAWRTCSATRRKRRSRFVARSRS